VCRRERERKREKKRDAERKNKRESAREGEIQMILQQQGALLLQVDVCV